MARSNVVMQTLKAACLKVLSQAYCDLLHSEDTRMGIKYGPEQTSPFILSQILLVYVQRIVGGDEGRSERETARARTFLLFLLTSSPPTIRREYRRVLLRETRAQDLR